MNLNELVYSQMRAAFLEVRQIEHYLAAIEVLQEELVKTKDKLDECMR